MLKMTTENPTKSATLKFMRKFARILKNPNIGAFKWSEDGKSVVIDCTLYKEETEQGKRMLGPFKKLKNIADLHGFLCSHGFQRITRKSTAEIQIFRRPDFTSEVTVGKNDAQKERLDDPCLCVHPQRGAGPSLGPEREGEAGQHSATWARGGGDLPDWSGMKRRPVRGLYQYINYSLCETEDATSHGPQHHSPLQGNTAATPGHPGRGASL